MSQCDAASFLVTIAHGGDTFDSPVSGNIQETVEFVEIRTGNRISPCTYVRRYGLRATATWAEFQNPVVRGTLANLVYTLDKADSGGTITVTVVTTRAGAANFDMSRDDFQTQSQEFAFDAGDAENFAPIAIT